MKQKHTKYTQH